MCQPTILHPALHASSGDNTMQNISIHRIIAASEHLTLEGGRMAVLLE